MRARIGDQLVIEGHKVGTPHRRGEVLEVSGETLRVRWGDGHESVFAPGPDCRVVSQGEAGTGHAASKERYGSHIDLRVTEDDERCEAVATLMTRRGSFEGRGEAHRHPNDEQVPMIGEELAIGRALRTLSQQLLDEARAADERGGIPREHLLE